MMAILLIQSLGLLFEFDLVTPTPPTDKVTSTSSSSSASCCAAGGPAEGNAETDNNLNQQLGWKNKGGFIQSGCSMNMSLVLHKHVIEIGFMIKTVVSTVWRQILHKPIPLAHFWFGKSLYQFFDDYIGFVTLGNTSKWQLSQHQRSKIAVKEVPLESGGAESSTTSCVDSSPWLGPASHNTSTTKWDRFFFGTPFHTFSGLGGK